MCGQTLLFIVIANDAIPSTDTAESVTGRVTGSKASGLGRVTGQRFRPSSISVPAYDERTDGLNYNAVHISH